jgi:hypothetical protein
VVIVVGSTLAARFGGGPQVVGSWQIAALSALVCAIVFGTPILAFTYERGRATPGWMSGLAAVAGALPLPLLGLSGLIGLYARAGDWDRVGWALERGLPIPAAGVIYWPRFLRLEAQAVLIGACCGLVFWLIMVRARPATRAFHILLALFAVGTLAALTALLR